MQEEELYKQVVPTAAHRPNHIQVFLAKTDPVGRIAVKEVLGTDRAGGQVSALVLLELSQVHAAVALHAVAHVSAQALAQAAQVAEGAVVDVPARLVIKELADVAVVTRHMGVAGSAFGCRIGVETQGQSHIGRASHGRKGGLGGVESTWGHTNHCKPSNHWVFASV